MKKHQKCIAEQRAFRIEVPSSKGDGNYAVEGTFEMGTLSCTCPGFKYNGTCRHTQFDTVECGWNGSESVEAQSLKEKEEHRCPRCGRRTVEVSHGKF